MTGLCNGLRAHDDLFDRLPKYLYLGAHDAKN